MNALDDLAAEFRQLNALAAEIRPILESNPDLGVDGWRCRWTDNDRRFAQCREEAFWPDFTLEVRYALELLADRRHGLIRRFKTGLEFAVSRPPYYHADGTPTAEAGTVRSLGAVIVAFIIAGVPFRRIPGSPDIEISAKRGREC